MASVLEMCNAALLGLGDITIGALTDTSRAAKLCNNVWEIVRDDVFRSYPWNCLQVRGILAAVATATADTYDYKYQLPVDPYCLRVLSMKEFDEDGEEYKIIGRYIITDADTCNILYIKKEEDPEQYDRMLTMALIARLRAEIAYTLTGNATLSAEMWKRYETVLRQARSVDAQEGTPPSLFDDSWLESRE